MKNLLLVFVFILTMGFLHAQGGAQIFFGLNSVKNTNPLITPTNLKQSGFTLGIQSRLKDGIFVAGPGLKYTRITMIAEDKSNFFSKEENYHFLTMPLNIGLEYRLSFKWKLRLNTGGDVTYFYKIDKNPYEIDFEFVHDYFFGAHAGIGLDFYWVTFDVIYEYGLSDAYRYENSKNNFLTATIGFFF